MTEIDVDPVSYASRTANQDMARLVGALVSRWKLVVGIVLVAAVFSAAAALILPPVYRATVVALPATEDTQKSGIGGLLSQFGGAAALAGIEVGGDDQSNEAIALLKSRQFTERFIDEKNLLPVLFPSRWDGELQRWKESRKGPPSLWEAYDLFDRRIRKVTQDRKTGLITINIDWRDGDVAASWANELVGRLNATMQNRVINEATATINYLNAELEKTSVLELRQTINGLLERQISKRALANVRPDFAVRVIDPAAKPDPRYPVRPNRLVIFLCGPAIGFGLAVIVVVLGLRREPLPSRG